MKLMGIKSWIHWSAWFAKYFIFLLIGDVLMTVIYTMDLGTGAVVSYTSPSLLFVFLVIYTVVVIWFCFAVSVFFNKGLSAVVCTLITLTKHCKTHV